MSAASDGGERGGGGGGGGGGGPAKTGAKSTATTKAGKVTAKGKNKDAPLLCGWCEKPGAKRRCSQCKSEVYCNEECQRVSACAWGMPCTPS